MKYVDEFRNPQAAKALLREIKTLSKDAIDSVSPKRQNQPLKLMEICGGHTHSIFKYAIEEILPDTIELIHGPGCPVCVMPRGRLDDAIAIAEHPKVIFATFGDAMRVPGSKTSLLQAKALGADIRMVYSPLDCLQMAKENPDKEVVFFGLGFETTAPSTALTIRQAKLEGLENFSIFCNHVLVIPALQSLLDNPDLQLDGFIGPGHVSMVIGIEPYQFIAKNYQKPLVVSGFEPLDILQSIWMILRQLVESRCEVENQYDRIVQSQGNRVALDAMQKVFEVRQDFEWRGLGDIPNSGFKIRPEFAQFDAEVKFTLPNRKVADHKACQCGEILKGVMKPWQCKVFGTACTPETPIGTCMVSSEGACAAYYKYGRFSKVAKEPMPNQSTVTA
ncbi:MULTISPECIES: hydrogenase formation protein HypD [unclassified Coleofasciculus]|uniref:hydrogenase formation protein HypD n=1 Tax=unclassified Coleofasciculus TaxID=2692782 RepID=UPI0018817165|nr:MULTISPECIES: hydrogenase formation protein HypD [unclassified Coleofasciculus]MBE9129585.1 hydrogenase formation protein HypD [Coleofasciculus sp. LEGE 07081]MBE9148265.1 hydrogenase formation protein HypD [Coleofasciculus sp. LEGE 07092]